MTENMKRVAVVGGGISGLAAAHRLRELQPGIELILYDAASRLGGVLDTVERDGYLFECSADGFLAALPWGVDFCKRVGLGDELISTDESRRKAFVVRRGRLEPVPEGFIIMAPRKIGSVLTSRILSPWAKLRLGLEYFVPARRDGADESVASFVSRRLGREVYDRLVQPLIGGIYTADPEKLSLAATMPQFLQMERDHGGLIRGAKRRRDASANTGSGARYSMFAAPRRGFRSLVEAVVQRLPRQSIRLNARVAGLAHDDGQWAVQTEDGQRESADGVILALPAPDAVPLLAGPLPELAHELDAIAYAGTAVVSLCYRREQIRHPLNGFGFVSPFIENRSIIAGSFLSQKYAGRAPADRVLIRVFTGGARRPDLVSEPEDALVARIHGELRDLLGITGDPLMHHLSRWPRKMPQYAVGHLDRVARIEKLTADIPGLELAGNAYRGVGVPYCIRSGEQAAGRLLERAGGCGISPAESP